MFPVSVCSSWPCRPDLAWKAEFAVLPYCFQSAFAVLGLAGQIWPDLAWKAELAVLPYRFQSVFAVLGLAGQIWPDLAWKACLQIFLIVPSLHLQFLAPLARSGQI